MESQGSGRRTVSAVFGDQAQWVGALPDVWRAVAWPERYCKGELWQHDAVVDHDIYGYSQRYWAALFHLVLARLGWVDPALGIARWFQQGRPTDDSALLVLDRWWGNLLDAVLIWDAQSATARYLASEMDLQGGAVVPPRSSNDQDLLTGTVRTAYARLGRHREAAGTPLVADALYGGGYDPLHLSVHVPAALTQPGAKNASICTGTDGRSAAALFLPRYAGRDRVLAEVGAALPLRPAGQGWRVDVTVGPVGWLGTYRRSRVTGRWFAGRHRHHALGWPAG